MSPSQRRRQDLGTSKLVNFIWLALFVGLGYFAVMYIPPYYEQWNVKSVLQDVANNNWREKDLDKIRMVALQRSKEKFDRDGSGRFKVVPEDIRVENNETTRKLTITMTWTRIIPYPLEIRPAVEKRFTKSYEVDTNPVTY